jgi:DNA-binding NarL/FixJ family response regulator
MLGARPLADEIRALAARARLRLPGSEPVAGVVNGGLTARELDVLQLLVDGRTNEQIGAALFMSPKTASVHVSHILQKLGAANRTEVATLAHRRGLISF